MQVCCGIPALTSPGMLTPIGPENLTDVANFAPFYQQTVPTVNMCTLFFTAFLKVKMKDSSASHLKAKICEKKKATTKSPIGCSATRTSLQVKVPVKSCMSLTTLDINSDTAKVQKVSGTL